MAESKRLETLDALRGVAAVAVIVYHWKLLTLLTAERTSWAWWDPPIDVASLPFYGPLKLFYLYGDPAVDLFFVISGFIFFHLYQAPIAEGRVTAGRFAALRFSRLYPLHLATLLAVAGLQLAFMARAGQPFVFDEVQPGAFLANLLFVNFPAPRFNIPTWSLTVELSMYALFWALARSGALRGWAVPLLLVGVGLALQFAPDWRLWGRLGHGMAGFFVGGLALKAFLQAAPRGPFVRACTAVALLGWGATLVLAYAGVDPSRFAPVGGYFLSQHGVPMLVAYGLFPATVIAAAARDRRRVRPNPVSEWLGSISYSTYLLHIPVIFLFGVAAAYGLAPTNLAHSGAAFAAYVVIVVGLARLSFLKLETPAQAWLRERLLGGRALASRGAGA